MRIEADSLLAPAFVIPHVAFPAFMDYPRFGEREEYWTQFPAVPVRLPGTDLFLRLVRLTERSDSKWPDHLSFVVHAAGAPVALCQAERVSACVLAVLATSQNTAVDPREFVVVPVPATMWPATELAVEELMDELGIGNSFSSRLHVSRRSLVERAQVGLDWVPATQALTRFFEDDDLLRSAMFFAASTSMFSFIGGDVVRARANPEEAPESLLLQADAETAIWLAYKSVEALLGHLPSKPGELQKRLVAEGFSDLRAGWRGEPAIDLATKLVSFTWDRDKRIAHGSMSRHRRKPITFYEVMDYQYLAMALIEHRLFI